MTADTDRSSERPETEAADSPPPSEEQDSPQGAVDAAEGGADTTCAADSSEAEADTGDDEPTDTEAASLRANEEAIAPDRGAAATGNGQDNGGDGSTRGQRPRALTLGVPCATLLLTAAIVLAVLLTGATAVQDDRAAARAVAEQVATDMLRLDHEHSEQVISGLLDKSTGPLRTQLTALSSTLTTVLRTGQVSAEGRIGTAGVERIDDTSAVVLVAAEATVRNTEIPQGQPRSYRIAVTLQKDGDRWLASAVDFVA